MRNGWYVSSVISEAALVNWIFYSNGKTAGSSFQGIHDFPEDVMDKNTGWTESPMAYMSRLL